MNDEELEQLLVELESEGATARERQAAERLRTALRQISQQYKALTGLREALVRITDVPMGRTGTMRAIAQQALNVEVPDGK